MSRGLFDGQPVTLEEMLAAREARVSRRAAALARHGWPMLTLSLVFPGSIKTCPAAHLSAEAALAAIPPHLDRHGWRHTRLFCDALPTGPEALYAVQAPPLALKSALVALEEEHTLGRLWDLDVHDAEGTPLSRRDVGLEKRRCLVCDAPAHACTRARAHPLGALQAAIATRLARAGLAPVGEPGKP